MTGLLRQYPDHPVVIDVYKSIGQLNYQLERFPAAAAWYKQAVDSTRTNAPDKDAYSQLIRSYRQSYYYDAELKLIREYLRLFPESPNVLDMKVRIGVALNNIGSYRMAIDHFQELLPEADVDLETEIAYYLGEAYKGLDLKEQAIAEYLKIKFYDNSSGAFPWKTTALYNIAQLYEQLGYSDKAIRYLKEIVAFEGQSSDFGRSAQSAIDRIEGKVY